MKEKKCKKRKNQKKRLLCLFLSSLLLFFHVSCIKKNKKNFSDFKETLHVHLQTEPPTLDWIRSSDMASSKIITNITEGLTSYDSNSTEIRLQPSLATSWTSSQKGKVWHFQLRKGVKWTDGVEFKAIHVIDAWERLLNPKTAAPYAYFLFNVKNAQAYYTGKIKDFSQVGVKSKGPYQLEVQLESPRTYFPSLLTHSSTWPIRKDVIEKYSKTWTQPGKIVSLGPFVLKEWKHDERLVLERNPHYYGKKPKLKKVIFHIVAQMSTAVDLFDTGKIDLIPDGLPSKQIRFLKKRKEYQQTPIFSFFYLGFNHLKAPTDDIKVRRALAHAIDRKEIVKLLEKDHIPLGGIIPKGLLGYDSSIGISFDPEKAKKELSASNYYKDNKDLTIEFSFNTTEDVKRIAENIQAQLQRNLNIKVNLINKEWKVYLKSLYSIKTTSPIYRMGWVGDYADPHTFTSLFLSISKNNNTGWKNKKYDTLVLQAAQESQWPVREKLYSQIQKIITEEEVAVFPVYSSIASGLVAKRVKNYYMSPMNDLYLKGVSVL